MAGFSIISTEPFLWDISRQQLIEGIWFQLLNMHMVVMSLVGGHFQLGFGLVCEIAIKIRHITNCPAKAMFNIINLAAPFFFIGSIAHYACE